MATDERLDETVQFREPFLGHPLLPISLREDKARTERVSSYVELDLLRFYEQYKLRMGARSVSEVIRRLSILGAEREGYQFDDPSAGTQCDDSGRIQIEGQQK